MPVGSRLYARARAALGLRRARASSPVGRPTVFCTDFHVVKERLAQCMHQSYKAFCRFFHKRQNGRPPTRHRVGLAGVLALFGSRRHRIGGAKRDRTADPLRARQVLSQLSYSPMFTGLFYAMRRCTCHSFSHILMYAPSLAPACALPSIKNPA